MCIIDVTSSLIRVSKSHFKAPKKRFSKELNVKFHGEELTKELFVEYSEWLGTKALYNLGVDGLRIKASSLVEA